MQKASFPGLMHRFLGKLKPDQHLRVVGTGKRREEDYSFCEVCCGILYALMMGIFRPIHMMELKADKVFQPELCSSQVCQRCEAEGTQTYFCTSSA